MDIFKFLQSLNSAEKAELLTALKHDMDGKEAETMYQWVHKNKDKMSVRLFNALDKNMKYFESEPVSELEWDDLKRIRNFGKKSWEEFNKIR